MGPHFGFEIRSRELWTTAIVLLCGPLFAGGPTQGVKPDSFELNPVLDFLSSPSQFNLEYRTTLIGEETKWASHVRQFLKDQERQEGAFYLLKAFVDEIRSSNPVSSPDVPPNGAGLYIGGTSEYYIAQGRTRFYQRLIEAAPSMPIVLRTPAVTLVYRPESKRLDFVDSSEEMDLRTLESIMQPLPLSTIARANWLDKASRIDRIDAQETSLTLDGGSLFLALQEVVWVADAGLG